MTDPEIEARAHRIYIAARQFHLAANVLRGQLHTNAQLVIPVAATFAFATELYLKCLVLLDTGEDAPWKHDYVVLFGLLKQETQQQIRSQFCSGGILKITADGKNERLEHEQERAKANEMFDKMLSDSKDAFRNIRYIYDGYPATWNVGPIIEIVVNTIEARHPEWKT